MNPKPLRIGLGALAGFLLLTPLAVAQPEGIHLVATSDARTIRVVWSADQGAPAGHVLLYSQGLESRHEAVAVNVPDDDEDSMIATLADLVLGTVYEYRVFQDDTPSRLFRFRIPAENEDVTVLAWGDQGALGSSEADGSSPQDVVHLAERHSSDYILLLGDLSYAHAAATYWHRYFRMLEPIAAERPLLAAVGNHEWGDLEQYHARMPMNDSTWYALRVGPVALIALDSENACLGTEDFHGDAPFQQQSCPSGPNAEQLAFLDKTLAEARDDSSVRWTVPFHHYGLYSRGKHASNHVLRNLWGPIYEKHGVDVVLQAHDHLYVRTTPIRANEAVDEGPVYVVAGTGGAELYHFNDPSPPPWVAARRDDVHGFAKVVFTESHIRGSFIDVQNRTLDSWSLPGGASVDTNPVPHLPSALVVAAAMVGLRAMAKAGSKER